ncbi:LacI family DNA-binding transcriptional regulator [Streptomyces sp. CO7]
MTTDRSAAGRPTLEAVARRAGVSRSTVSRVINGQPAVSPDAVRRVREVVRELGYVPNQNARSLVTRRSDTVAVVITEPQHRLFVDPYFSLQQHGIRRELVERGSYPVLLFIEEPEDYARVEDFLSRGHVDGALLLSLRADDPLPDMTDRLALPAVCVGRRPLTGRAERSDRYLYVNSDNRGGAREAVRHLVGLGRRAVATITGAMEQTAAVDRLRGYRDVLPDAAPEMVVEGDFTEAGGAAAMRRLLERNPEVDAVFVASDLMAAGALRVLRERGRRVPEDVAVVGFDDIPAIAEAADPPLTTVNQDAEELGRLMARTLLDHIADCAAGEAADRAPLTPVIMPTRLVLRASA